MAKAGEHRDDGAGPPFYERRVFQGTAAVIALLTALLSLTGSFKDGLDTLFPESSTPASKGTAPGSWVEVVLNTSSVMGLGFGNGGLTRLEAAGEAVSKAVKELDNAGVGLRRTPASCDKESERLVDVANGRAQAVVRKAQTQEARGHGSIVDAILGGLDEFARNPMRRHSPKTRHLFVFTTEDEMCPFDDPTGEVKQMLKEADFEELGSVQVFALHLAGSQASFSTEPRTQLASLASTRSFVSELETLEAVLGPRVKVRQVGSPAQLFKQAEEVGQKASDTAEEVEEEGEGEGGGEGGMGGDITDGASDQGGPQ